jgi:hypothetical protein
VTNSSRESPSQRLEGADAVRLHITLIAGLALAVTAFTIELIRALSGHAFSWLYVVEWPIFGSFGIYVWWVLLHGHDRARPGPTELATPAHDGRDEALDAWTRYLAVMEAAEHEEHDPTT